MSGRPPLVQAVCKDDIKRVKTLLAQGYDVNEQDEYGNTALDFAASRSGPMTNLLLDSGASMDTPGDDKPIHTAAEADRTSAIKALLDHGDDVNRLNHVGYTPLHVAVQSGKFRAVRYLLDHGADISRKHGPMAMKLAAYMGNEEMVALLDRRRCYFEVEAAMEAISGKNLNILKYILIKTGLPVNSEGKRGKTMLEHAIDYNHPDAVEFLVLERGANVNLRNKESGMTPLHIAVRRTEAEMITLLLKKGAKINAKNSDGATPLCCLLRTNGNLNIDKVPEIMKLLLDNGADPNIRDNDGKLPLDYARQHKAEAISDWTMELFSKYISVLMNPRAKVAKYQPDPSFNPRRRVLDGGGYDAVEDSRSHVRGRLMSLPKKGAGDAWFRDYQEFYEVLQEQNPETDGYERVRIAIIDSGVTPDHPHLDLVQDYQDFAEGDNDTKKDNTLHGSTGLHLLAKIAPEADYYVARVFEEEEASASTARTIARAIKYAQEKWKVDVIALACGFQDDDSAMRKAIEKASDNGVLIFAAASNEGNRHGITFPARMWGRTMCMFGSDGNSKISAVKFNPAPANRQLNFAFPGKDVEGMGEKIVNGTSIATFVGAGVAAGIIDFSRQKGVQGNIGDATLLNTVRGMSEVFDGMSEMESGYHCVVPIKALRCKCENKQNHTAADKRNHLCSRLFTALTQ